MQPSRDLALRVRDWAKQIPNQVALVDDEREVSASALWKEAQSLCKALENNGIGAGHLVLIEADERLDVVAAMVACWLSGSAYLLMPANIPDARKERLVHLARAMASMRVRREGGLPVTHIEVNSGPTRDLPHDAAWVVFTSGSTGEPKGVVLGQRGITDLFEWFSALMDRSAGESTMQVSDFGFDAVTLEVWGAIRDRQTLHFPSTSVASAPSTLAAYIRDRRIVTSFIPTGLVGALLDEDWAQGFRPRTILTGGDRLTRWMKASDETTLVNGYGPSECTIVVISDAVGLATPGVLAPPIGVARPGVQIRVVDDRGIDVTGNGIGELWLGGSALALGYLVDDGVAPVDAETPGWYHTGDFVRQDPSGALHFVGRRDEQVKISGRRTEPAEVQRATRETPGVQEALAAVFTNPAGRKAIGALFVGECTPEDVVEWVTNHEPANLVPRPAVKVDKIGLTPAGKFDMIAARQLLQDAEEATFSGFGSDETVLAEAWSTGAGVRPKSRLDSLAHLGARSLDVFLLTALLSKNLNLQLSADIIRIDDPLHLQAEKLAAAKLLRGHEKANDEVGHRTGSLGSVGQEGLVFVEQISESALGYQYQMVLAGPGQPDPSRLRHALEAVVSRHPVFRTQWRLGLKGLTAEPRATTVELVVHNVSTESVEIAIDARIKNRLLFDDFPLVRWDLFLHPGGAALLHREHHLVHDGWSVGVFLRDLMRAYRGEALSEERVQDAYLKWSDDERKYLSTSSAADREYWQRALTGVETDRFAPNWFAGRPMPSSRSRSRMNTFQLGRTRSTQIEEAAKVLEVTPFQLMSAAFRRLIYEISGSTDIVIGCALANRPVSMVDEVGMLVNVVPVRVTVRHDETPADSARREMEVQLGAAAHGRLPTAEIIRAISLRASGGYNPLYQVSFSQHDSPAPELSFGDWSPVVDERANGRGKNDLNVIVGNRGLQHARERGGSRDGGEYFVRWECDPDIYSGDQAAIMQSRFLELLDNAINEPFRPWPSPMTITHGS